MRYPHLRHLVILSLHDSELCQDDGPRSRIVFYVDEEFRARLQHGHLIQGSDPASALPARHGQHSQEFRPRCRPESEEVQTQLSFDRKTFLSNHWLTPKGKLKSRGMSRLRGRILSHETGEGGPSGPPSQRSTVQENTDLFDRPCDRPSHVMLPRRGARRFRRCGSS
jgi:hypothetical protein